MFLGNNTEAQFDLFDIERLEVLRGPRNLFGVNTIGGVVNIVTTKPAYDFGGHVDFILGNYDYTRGRLALTGPVFGKAGAAKISALYNLRDEGYVDNVFDGRPATTTRPPRCAASSSSCPPTRAVLNFTIDYRDITQHSKYFDILGDSPLLDALSGFDFDTDPYDRTVNANLRGIEELDGIGGSVTAESPSTPSASPR